jgi:hypothetical protein
MNTKFRKESELNEKSDSRGVGSSREASELKEEFESREASESIKMLSMIGTGRDV